jgi:hypothetical protein
MRLRHKSFVALLALPLFVLLSISAGFVDGRGQRRSSVGTSARASSLATATGTSVRICTSVTIVISLAIELFRGCLEPVYVWALTLEPSVIE